MKAQMEIMGLAIIIILVILGLLFGMTFLGKESPDIKQSFEEKTLATSFLNTLLGTSSTCHKATFRVLIQDCAQGGQTKCPPSNQNSCEQVKEDFKAIFADLLEVRKKGFRLIAKGPGEVSSISIGEECPEEVVAGYQNIPTKFGQPVEIVLQICS